MEGLVELLDAARASTPGEDLAGERAAVAGFLAARQRAVPTAPPRRKNRAVRTLAMKGALGVAVLAFGGTALAARTGSLPPSVQERAHDVFSNVGVPAPAPDPSTQPTAGGGTPSAVPSPPPAPTPARSVSSSPAVTAVLDLCRAWDAAREDPPGKAVPAPDRRALAAAAGGMPKIDDFCAGLLGKPAGASEPAGTGTPTEKPKPNPKPSSPGKPPVTPSHPGKGHGKPSGPVK
ncbi:hypothetical protein ACWEOZ_13230 [Actinoplanes sp. NPDC004185]